MNLACMLGLTVTTRILDPGVGGITLIPQFLLLDNKWNKSIIFNTCSNERFLTLSCFITAQDMLYDYIISILPCLYYIFQLWLVFLLSYVAHNYFGNTIARRDGKNPTDAA